MRLQRGLDGHWQRPAECFTGAEPVVLGATIAEGGSIAAGSAAAAATSAALAAAPGGIVAGSTAGVSAASLLGFSGLALNLLGIGGQTAAGVQSANLRAQLAEQEAASLRDAAIFNAQQSRRRAALAISKGVATGAASGLDVQFGSPLLFELDNVMQAEVEAQNILRSGSVGASGKEFESKLARSSIPGTIFSGAAQAGGSVLSSFIRRSN